MLAIGIGVAAIVLVVGVGLTKNKAWGEEEGSKVKIAVIIAIGIVAGVLSYISGSGSRYHVKSIEVYGGRRYEDIFDSLKGEGYIHNTSGDVIEYFPTRKWIYKKEE
jgi:hypothetical protein